MKVAQARLIMPLPINNSLLPQISASVDFEFCFLSYIDTLYSKIMDLGCKDLKKTGQNVDQDLDLRPNQNMILNGVNT